MAMTFPSGPTSFARKAVSWPLPAVASTTWAPGLSLAAHGDVPQSQLLARLSSVRVVVAREGWEFRPRAKLQALLRRYFLGPGGEAASALEAANALSVHARLLRDVIDDILNETRVEGDAAR